MERFNFQALVEHLPLVVYIDELDERCTPLYISPQILRLLGWSQDEWLADPDLFVNSVHPEDREHVRHEVAARNTTGAASHEAEYRLIARDGSTV